MRISIHGSRTLRDERVRIIIMEALQKTKADHIVTHGEPEGVCEMGRKIARELALPLTLHFLNFKFLRGAFEHRSKAVLTDSDYAIFIHDGKSRGTANELKLAKKMRIKHEFHKLPPTPFKSSVGFEIEKDWDFDEAFLSARLGDLEVNIPELSMGDPKPSRRSVK